MAWDFLYSVRQEFQGDNNWGRLYIRTEDNKWEYLSYTYELPYKENQSGPNYGKTQSSQSRIKIGVYELVPRSDGPKGWRLELQNTGHRQNIQIHRAHTSMFIEGCILPVHFNNFAESNIKKGDQIIQTQSVALMNSIKTRYDLLKTGKTGNPTICISANLPPKLITKKSAEYA